MAVQESGRTKGFVCKHCSVVCANMPSLLEHMESHQESAATEEDRKFKCDECGRGYRHAGSLANHKKAHEVGSFQCHICERQLSNSLALKMHLRIHTSRKKYECTECGKAFRLATQLATHQRVHRNGGARGSGGGRRGSANAAENARGRRSFDVAPDLEPDMSLDLEGEEEGEEEDDFGSGGAAMPGLASNDKTGSSDDAGDRPFKCNMCDKSYRHYGSLYRHKESHQMGAFECPICFKQLNNQAAMTAHQRTHGKTMGGPASASGSAGGTHADRKPYMGSQQNGGSGGGADRSPSEANFCHLCQVSFPNEDEFQDHVLLHNSSSVSFELPVNMPDEDPGLIYSASQSPDYPPSSDTPPMPPLLDKQQEDYEQPVGSVENGQIYIPDDPFQDHDQEPRPPRQPPVLNSQRASRSSSARADLQEGDDSFNHEVKEEEESESPDGGDRKFKCDVCHKSYRHAGSLINHKRSHQTGVFQCSICRKNYPHMAALRSHHRLHRAQTSQSLGHGAEGDWLSSEPQTLENQHGGYLPSDQEMEEDLEMGEEDEELGVSLLEPPDVQVQQQARGAPAMHHEQGMDQQQQHHHQHPNRGGQQHPHIQHASGDEGGDAMGYHDQYDVPYPQDGTPTGHLPHDDGGPPPAHLMERHMCADCGKTFGDIASIKSHPCPMRQAHHHAPHPHHHHNNNQQQDHHSQHPHPHHQHNSITNGSHSGHMDYHHHSPHLIGESGTPVGYDSSQGYYGTPDHHNPHHPQQGGYHQNMHAGGGGGGGGMMGSGDPARGYGGGGGRGMQDQQPRPDDEDNYDGGGEEEDEEDGEMYHCSVCGNHYASMGALRTHLRGHTQVHGTPSSSGPSSMSSLEAEKDEEPGESHQGDGSLIICSTCGESFTRKQDLVAHQLLHNQNQAPSTPVDHHLHPHHQQQYPHHQSPMQHLGPPPPPPPPLTHYGSSPNSSSIRSSKPKPAGASSSTGGGGGGGAGGSLICNKCGISCVSFQHLENHPCPGRRISNEVKSEVIKPDVEAPMLGRNDARRPKENQGGGGVGGSSVVGVGGDRLFKCDQCGRAYRHAGSLLNHKKSHKTGVFRCYVCQKRFYNLLALKSHERTHFDIKKHTCNECGKAFKIQKQLQNHLRVHEENKAKIQELNKQIQTLMQMNGELAQNGLRKAQRRRRRQPSVTGGGSAGPSPEKGSDGGGSSTVQSPGAAAGTPHDPNDPRPYACNQCGRSYRHAGSLVNHKNSHKTGEYHCSICNNTYSNQLAMKNHLRIHFGLKKHACQECGKAFRGKKQLLSHRCAANRKNADGNGPPRSRSGRRKPRQPTCRKCRTSFPTPAELEAHECKGPPPGAADGTPREERPYKCGICGRSYRHAGSLLNHKNTHNTGHFSCTFCSKPFSNPMALRSHTRIHTQKKKHVCPTCGKAFRLSSILHNHLKIHTRGNCTFSCPTCNKTFQGRSGLKRHRCLGAAAGGGGGGGGGGGSRSGSRSGGRSRRSSANGQESGDRCYTCDQCGRSYRHAGSLLNHKKTHSADLLNCGLCLRTFADAAELERHSQMPRHCCPDCGKTFCEFAHMQSHMEVHSKGRPLQGAVTSPTGSVASGASGSGYHHHPHPLHHPHQQQQQQHHPHPHHPHLGHPHHPQQMHHPHPHHPHIQTPYPGYPPRHHPDGMPMAEDEMDWHSGMDPRGMAGPGAGSGGSLPKIGQAFGAGGGSSMGGGVGGGGDGGSSSGAYPSDMQDHGEDGDAPGGGDPEEKSHVCEHCGRAYRHAGSLLNHKNSHKTGSFFCAVCQKEFSNLMALKNHRRIHTEPKRYQCLECGKAFRVSTQLICHRRIHTKEKPFSCLLCDKRFSSKSNLRHHQKMHQNSQASYEAAFDMDPGSFMGLGVDPFL